MHPPNLSTSTSNSGEFIQWMEALKTGFWTLLFLIIVDTAINVVFAMPSNVKQEPSRLQFYFNYGRSMEGKLRTSIGSTPETTAPIVEVGWLADGTAFQGQPTEPRQPGQLMIATYGSSFSVRMADAIAANHPNDVTIRSIAAPLGPMSWAYAAYQDDRHHQKAQAVVLTIMSTNAMEYTFGAKFSDLPPLTRPLFSLKTGELERIDPLINTLPQMRKALLEDPQLWQSYCQQVQQYDPYYDPFLFRASLLDQSSLIRLIRRGYGTVMNDQKQSKFYGKHGFNPNSSAVQLSQALIKNFAESARSDGVIPVVYIVNNRGWKTALYDVMHPLLDQNDIAYVSSHTIVPPDDPRLFMSDGHFDPEKDAEVSEAILKVIRERIANRDRS